MRTSILTLLFILSGLTSLAAQVGVNNPDPTQALDVDGKLKLTDDATLPTAGTLRYNASLRQFEGHDGTEWTALTNGPKLAGGAIPEGAIPVYGKTSGILANDEVEEIRMYYGDGSTSTLFVPANTYLIVTWINVRDNDIVPASANVLVRVGPGSTPSSNPNATRGMYLHGDILSNIWVQSSLSPLVICRPFEYLLASNSRFSEEIIEVEMRGFLVPDLDY